MKSLILVLSLIAGIALAQDSAVSRFMTEKDSLIQAVNMKWYVDSISISYKIDRHRQAIERVEDVAVFSDQSQEEIVASHAEQVAALLKELHFYRKERDEKIRSAFKAFTQK